MPQGVGAFVDFRGLKRPCQSPRFMNGGDEGFATKRCLTSPGGNIWWVLEIQVSKFPWLESWPLQLTPALLFMAILMNLLLLCH